MHKFSIVFVLVVVSSVSCHVSLTFPPARRLALDFLDNYRTTSPCGMPGIGPVTQIQAGITITVTWQQNYPHKGGYFLEILNENNTQLLREPSTPGAFLGDSDPTVTSHPLTIPRKFICPRCKVRIVRQALDWSTDTFSYNFWSCADVNIVPSVLPRQTCLKGTEAVNGCSCPPLYSGDNCQNKDDCVNDRDCNGNGKCHDNTGNSYPSKQCFCKAGTFGRFCEKQSALSSTKIDYSNYIRTALSADFTLFHRILKDIRQIEVIMKVKTKTWVAVGFRPKGDASKPGGSTPEPETTLKPEPEKSTAEPEKTYKPEPEKSTPKSEKSTPEPEKSTTKPEKTVIPVLRNATAKAEKTLKPEPEKSTVKAEPEKSTYVPGKTLKPEPEHSTPEPEVTGGYLHAMDKTDMVIGKAYGVYGHVADYYSRDRSTPQLDEFYSGTQSLTAALAFEDGDFTIVMFRKPLKANEDTDYDIVNENMHVIWAQGQESLYYKRDELKYHGWNGKQRGKTTMNFYQMPTSPVVSQGFWSQNVNKFHYNVSWSYNEAAKAVDFVFAVNIGKEKRWVALGFSKDKQMGNTDVIAAWVDETGAPHISDRWNSGSYYSPPRKDDKQNIEQASVLLINNYITVKFRRYAVTSDPLDFQFTPDNCPYVIHAIGGGYNSNTETMERHPFTPAVSNQPVCFIPKKQVATTTPKSAYIEHRGVWNVMSAQRRFGVSYTYVPSTDLIEFVVTVEIGNDPIWVALGFSDDKFMANTDIILAWIGANGVSNITDRWASRRSMPAVDSSQDIMYTSVIHENGLIVVNFTRPATTTDTQQDFQFTPGNCPYVFHGVGGGFDETTGDIDPHPETPTISPERVCIVTLSGGSSPASTAEPTSEPTTSATPRTDRVWSIDVGSYTFNVEWEIDTNTKLLSVQFSVQLDSQDKWIALGFSDNTVMSDTDVIAAWFDDQGQGVVSDRWATGYSRPPADSSQDLTKTSVEWSQGVMTVKFTRSLTTKDANDYQFSETDCPYVVHAVGRYSNGISKHTQTPALTKEKICFVSAAATKKCLLTLGCLGHHH